MGSNKTSVTTAIQDADTGRKAGVELQDGKNRLLTSSVVIIDQLFGRSVNANTWGYIGTADDANGVGDAGDVVSITIPAASPPLDVLYPAVSVDTTVQTEDVNADNPERSLADRIVTNLNADANFSAAWEAEVIKDFSGIFIKSKFFNGFGNRSTWSISATGNTSVTQAETDIILRGLPTELSFSPNDPRKGVLAIQGSVTQRASDPDQLFEIDARRDSDNENDISVNGSVTPQVFQIDAEVGADLFITQLIFHGVANGIKYDQFLSLSTLTNGILVEVEQDGSLIEIGNIKKTDDLDARWSPGGEYRLKIAAGGDHVTAAFDLTDTPIKITRSGVLAVDEFVRVTVRDDLSGTSITNFFFTAQGFKEEA